MASPAGAQTIKFRVGVILPMKREILLPCSGSVTRGFVPKTSDKSEDDLLTTKSTLSSK